MRCSLYHSPPSPASIKHTDKNPFGVWSELYRGKEPHTHTLSFSLIQAPFNGMQSTSGATAANIHPSKGLKGET